jgi:hypothetical protein
MVLVTNLGATTDEIGLRGICTPGRAKLEEGNPGLQYAFAVLNMFWIRMSCMCKI